MVQLAVGALSPRVLLGVVSLQLAPAHAVLAAHAAAVHLVLDHVLLLAMTLTKKMLHLTFFKYETVQRKLLQLETESFYELRFKEKPASLFK